MYALVYRRLLTCRLKHYRILFYMRRWGEGEVVLFRCSFSIQYLPIVVVIVPVHDSSLPYNLDVSSYIFCVVECNNHSFSICKHQGHLNAE